MRIGGAFGIIQPATLHLTLSFTLKHVSILRIQFNSSTLEFDMRVVSNGKITLLANIDDIFGFLAHAFVT